MLIKGVKKSIRIRFLSVCSDFCWGLNFLYIRRYSSNLINCLTNALYISSQAFSFYIRFRSSTFPLRERYLFLLREKREGSQVVAGKRTLNPAGSAPSMDHARYQCFVVNPRGTYRLHGTSTCLVNICMMYGVPGSYSSYLSTVFAMTCTYTIAEEWLGSSEW